MTDLPDGRKSMLVVDDDPEICGILTSVGEHVGFTTQAIQEADQLLSAYSALKPDVIILDLKMPNVDGALVLKSLAMADCKADIVLFSGADTRVLNTAARLGESQGLKVQRVLQKPIDLDDLETELRNLLGARSNSLETDLRDAIATEAIDVHYQPKVSLRDCGTWQVVGLEALARWHHPTRGFVSPVAFIPLAENIGIIGGLTKVVINKAVAQAASLQRKGYQLDMAINLSPSVLADPDAPDSLANVIAAYGTNPEQTIVEVTESVAMAEGAQAMENLTRFRLKNIRLAMDDFGTGYSSLLQLYRMPFSELKIDKSLISDLTSNREARVIVRSTVELAHSLGLSVCAEGIENVETLQYLESIGCDQAQGFLMSKPLAPEALMDFLASTVSGVEWAQASSQ